MSKAKKLKKPLDLPLGKAVSQKDVDLSHVRLPIDTSVLGLKHVLTLFETATNEVKSYLAYECDLMYECRICRTIFRSIANFILHKRKYCKDTYNSPRDPGPRCQESNGISIIQRDIETANKIIAETEDSSAAKVKGSSLNPIIEQLLKKQEQKKLVEEIKNENSTISPKSEPSNNVEDLRGISLEKIDGSDVAVFQTMEFGSNLGDTELMKSEVMEIHSIFDKNEAVIGSDGKIILFDVKEKNQKFPLNKNDYLCTECNMRFSTKKTLKYHVKYKHSQTRLIYPCPLCKDELSNAWSVYRHLLKVHRMTSSQIRKYRTQIHNSAILKKAEERKDNAISTKENKEGRVNENEWLDNVEGDSDLQMCGGCGKHFDRKAALTSHSVMCVKRIAVCNSIKENSSKKHSDDKESVEKSKTNLCRPREIGSAKRKSKKVIMYKPKFITEETDILPKDSKEDKHEIKEVNENVSSILEENDSDVECLNNDWMRKEIQSLDKDELLSIIGVDTCSTADSKSPSSVKNTSPQPSECSESPCRGFESQSNDNEEDFLVVPGNTMKEIETNSVNHSSDPKIDLEDSENTKIKDDSTTYSTKIPIESEMDVSSDISLDNKINCDFKLDLGKDPNFTDVSIKLLIKEIIGDDPSAQAKQNEIEELNNQLNENIGVRKLLDDGTLNNNTSIQKGSSSTRMRKRKRSNALTQERIIKASKMKSCKKNMDESETTTFMSKISPFVDEQNLTCSLCNSRFASSPELFLHMSNHFSWYRFQCSECLFMSFNKTDCERHVERDHNLPCHIPGAVLPIPAWKSSLISNNFMLLNSEERGEDSKTERVDFVKQSLNHQAEVPEVIEVELVDFEKNIGDDVMESINSDSFSATKGKDNILEYIDLTEVVTNDTDLINFSDNLQLEDEANSIKDLSKQAIMEVILGNDPKKEMNSCIPSQSSEHIRPSRNRTKSIKASQKDFIYDFDTPKQTSTKAYCSRDDTERFK